MNYVSFYGWYASWIKILFICCFYCLLRNRSNTSLLYSKAVYISREGIDTRDRAMSTKLYEVRVSYISVFMYMCIIILCINYEWNILAIDAYDDTYCQVGTWYFGRVMSKTCIRYYKLRKSKNWRSVLLSTNFDATKLDLFILQNWVLTFYIISWSTRFMNLNDKYNTNK